MSLGMLLAAMAAFVGGHFVIAGTPLRGAIVRRVGERPYRGLFAAYALATLAWAIVAYGRALRDVVLWPEVAGLRWLALLLTAAAAVLIVSGLSARNMAVIAAGRPLGPGEAKGVHAITRHPVNMGVALWALAHLLANGDAASVILFGGFLVLALLGPLSQDAKKKRDFGAAWERFAAATSYWPLVAMISGRARLRVADIGWWRLAAAALLFIALLAVHEPLFGASPLPL